jgi:hypothetical protein
MVIINLYGTSIMMIFNIHKLLKRINKDQDIKINLLKLSKDAGVNRNLISRMVHQPEVSPTCRGVEKLILYFHSQLLPTWEGTEKELMDSIMLDFISVVKEEDYRKLKEARNNAEIEFRDKLSEF